MSEKKPSPAVRKPTLPSGTTPVAPPGATPAGPPAKPSLSPGKLPPGNGAGPRGPSGVERIKEQSQGLRGRLTGELGEATDHFSEAGKQLLKFHGIYQQDDRDDRSNGKQYSFMLRSRLPGGRLTAEQYLVHEALADAYANGTLRLTTRQAIQLHGVLKGDLQATLRGINEALATTLGACGDVVRNVTCCPAPEGGPLRDAIERVTQQISDHFLPQTRAYHEVWLGDEKVYDGAEHVETIEPIYGKAYLPRKFKIGIAYPGDNCVDVYTQDVGLLAVAGEGQLAGFNVLVGGGLGMTHKKAETYPRLADTLAFVAPEEVLKVIEHIVGIQRDHGDRTERRHARMKYLVAEWGLPRFRRELEDRLGYTLRDPVPTPPLELDLHLGWHAQEDGRYYLGLSVENGRVEDRGTRRLKTGLHALLVRFRPDVRLTPNQDVLLSGIHADERDEVEAILRDHGIPLPEELSNARKYSMACPALPTCGLAITEAERVLPGVIDRFEEELAGLGLAGETLSIRMTGCPNGCARPYVADIGFVGRSLDQYTVFLGGRTDGTRLNQPFRDLVPLDELVATVRPVLVLFAQERRPGESFGDFCHRIGPDALQAYTENVEETHA